MDNFLGPAGYNRSSDAIKNRFHTHILAHIESTKFRLSDDEIRKFRSALRSAGDVEEEFEEIEDMHSDSKETPSPEKGKGKQLKKREKEPVGKAKDVTVTESEADSIQISNEKKTLFTNSLFSSLCLFFPPTFFFSLAIFISLYHLLTLSHSLLICTRIFSSVRGRPYTKEEDQLMINYIVKTKRFAEVRGKVLWVDIENIVLRCKLMLFL